MYMKRYLLYFVAFVCLCSSAAIARADLISIASFSQQGGQPFGVNEVHFVLEFTTDNGWGDAVTPLFNQSISPNDVGKTFTADSSTPFFANNIALATDGKNNRVGFMINTSGGGGAGSLFYEASIFHGAPHDPFYSGIPDLLGNSITRVTFHLDKLDMWGGSHAGDFYDFNGTVSFFDDSNLHNTPEPASWCLALLSTLGIAVWRMRKKLSPGSLGTRFLAFGKDSCHLKSDSRCELPQGA
jgi:hypothetical protein